MEDLFLSHIELLGNGLYVLFAVGLLFEGEVLIFVVTYLVYQGYMNLFGSLFVALVTFPLGDFLWYSLGRHVGTSRPRIKQWVDWMVRIVAHPLDRRLAAQTISTLLISKFTYGFHRPTLIRAGIINVPARHFFRSDVVASWIWIGIVGLTGYAAAAWLSRLRKYLKFAEVGLLIGILAFLFISSIVSRLSSESLEKP